MIDLPTIRGGDAVGPTEYQALLGAVGWRSVEQADAALRQALETTWNATARTADGRLVGLARVLDDGFLYGSVWDVIVAPAWQRNGLGRALMEVVLERTAGRRLVALVSTAAGEALYRATGFAESNGGSTALFLRPDPVASNPGRGGA
ncbi:MAG: GNAT family N-acetyltransferase [Chloroflexota bacterium]|nr:GNAT family N-acetyltransferase [Chloroflexota bacterium]